MVPVSGSDSFRPKFGGQIWIDAHGSCSYQCAFCKNKFFSAGSFEFHISMAHINEIKTNPFVQSHNNKNNTETPPHRDRDQDGKDTHNSSNRFANAKTHNESSGHPRRQELMCIKCNERFANLELLRTHTQKHHLFGCTYCIKSFETQQGLWSHQRNHHESTFPYKCKVCPRAFKRRNDLFDHTQIKHARGNNNVKCDFCPKMLMSVFEKDNHIKKNHSNRRYYCSLCTDYWSTSERNVRRHMKEKHPGQAPRDY